MRISSKDRFMRFVRKVDGGCWLWQGKRTNAGYGEFWFGKKHVGAHRVSLQLFSDVVIGFDCVLHHCDVRLCVNPEHLYVGTYVDNMKDRQVRGQASRKLTIPDVLEIRSDGRSTRKIGADYGVSAQTVSEIKRRKIWRHV